MTLRKEMLQVSRLAPRLLGESTDLVDGFVRGQANADGGFRDRSGDSDLYYTVFALECLQALQRPLPRDAVAAWIAGFAAGEGLDFVHRCCLARCWAILGGPRDDALAGALAQGIAAFRAADGGFAQRPGEARGNAYAAYLAFGALQDLAAPLPDPREVAGSLAALRAADGGYANHPGAATGSTPATVSAMLVLRACERPVDRATTTWLLARAAPDGGFTAGPAVPLPDLLSTATALHALAGLQVALPADRVEAHLDFVDSLWTNAGAFHGHWAEEALDCEYTYYGLLALGHLGL